MKRLMPLAVLFGTAGLLASALGADGETPPTNMGNIKFAGAEWAKPCPAQSYCAATSAHPDPFIDELTTILNETKSPETFLVTTMVLGRLGTQAKRALPAIIRNAERLELFDELYSGHATADNRDLAAQEVIAALEMILDKKGGMKGRIWASQPRGAYAPITPSMNYAPTSYAGGCSSCPSPPMPSIQPASTLGQGAIKPIPANASGVHDGIEP